MLDLLALTLANFLGKTPPSLEVVPVVAWQEAKVFDVPTQSDSVVESIIADYLKNLADLGFSAEKQGIWFQSDWAYLGDHQSQTPLSAASLTKIATSLAALETWGTQHRFETEFLTVGTVENGVLKGDLIVKGSGDPLFVWEEAIAVGNKLNELGIKEVTGNLIIVDNFAMNFKSDPPTSGQLLQLALNSRRWTPIIQQQYQKLPPNTPKPQITIQGTVKVQNQVPETAKTLLTHQSLTMAELLKQMNIYSNNVMSEMIAESVGGAAVVSEMAAKAAKVDSQEIQLINGSGLGVENRISPRASVGMLMAIEEKLKDNPLSVADLFPMGGRDTTGTVQWRNLPDGVAVKTGTLAQVSALAGVIPTKERGLVWFAIINHGSNVDRFRVEQDRLLQKLANHWNLTPIVSPVKATQPVKLGDPKRNLTQES
ncbi:putative peptidase S13, D-Ala-D-Ala carboxypeptidase C [Crocosphaera subtropica ATCC 51142]|uniref:Peptidase S13, D-Ala-D-Ala carboxypeptidase C n=1 Tax=Crocosphaera subtropica (strain ATCC 51142 / BH68) TaxID=43989 RepID=B1WSW5_CROS5|nr:D-alanyl-D-alanine carboxypeptidase [Crocosphaera subtropica]ACB50295.1 putative peptidase S13, D-Ala-D-Ala carboxypeptidase C [Crocosphaera subtropica ATCC 51142]